MRRFNIRALLLALPLAAGLAIPVADLRAQTAPTDRIATISSIALASRQPARLYLTSRYGLLRAEPSGMASLIPGLEAGLSALAVHPDNPGRLLASGYDRDGGKLGVVMSDDGGESWTRIADGANGPVAFHALDVSRSNPDIVYGLSDGLQVSRDGGKSWQATGTLPAKVYDMAVSAADHNTLYAAARDGLFASRDGGAGWAPALPDGRPASMVHSAPDGRVYAFVLGIGLVTAKEPDLAWSTLFADVADRYFLHMAVDPKNPARLYASVDTGALMTSADGGRSWSSFEGSHRASPQTIAKGRQVYEDNCQACHGGGGVGESPDDPYAKDEYGFKAPALNNDAHAWHHSDENLMHTIRNGSPRNERMAAFKDSLSEDDVANVVVYIKSLWTFRSLACQGARHMACMGR